VEVVVAAEEEEVALVEEGAVQSPQHVQHCLQLKI
jgi:hypothetical protein